MQFTCPICNYSGSLFKPAGTIKTESGRRKLRSCPNCNSLTLSAPLALRAALVKLKGTSLVDAETADLTGGAFAQEAFDVVVMGENWTYESRDISLAIRLHEVLRSKGWLVVLPLNYEDAQHKLQQLNQLGFSATIDPGIQREPLAVNSVSHFLQPRRFQFLRRIKNRNRPRPLTKIVSSGIVKKAPHQRYVQLPLPVNGWMQPGKIRLPLPSP